MTGPLAQQYQKCVDQKCVDALDRLTRNFTTADERLDGAEGVALLATVRETLERQQSRIYILENMRSENYIEALEATEAEIRRLRDLNAALTKDFNTMLVEESKQRNRADAAEAEVRRLTEGLRERDELIRKTIYSPPGFSGPDPWWADKARALLSANPPQGDAAAGSSPSDGGREGMVTAYDHQGGYVGCIGEQTWRWLIDHPEVDAPALLRAFEMYSPPDGGEPWESFASSQGGIFNGPHPADEEPDGGGAK